MNELKDDTINYKTDEFINEGENDYPLSRKEIFESIILNFILFYL